MVYYFTSSNPNYTIYMGHDKDENEVLIKYGHFHDIWFHVENYSSAHVYLRVNNIKTLHNNNNNIENINIIDTLSNNVLLECASLVKHNSIQGCKFNHVNVVYTPWKNLKKTYDMVDGVVGYHNDKLVKKIMVEKNKIIVNRLNKTRVEKAPDLYQEQQEVLKEITKIKKKHKQMEENKRKLKKLELEKNRKEKSYDRIMKVENMKSNVSLCTDDTCAAVEYEEEFF